MTSNTRPSNRSKTSAPPWGRVNAIIDPTKANANPRFVTIGAAWMTDAGNLKLRIEATPPQWDDPHYPRTILVVKSEGGSK